MSKTQIAKYAFKVPLLFEGDRGSGKTYDVREFAKQNSLPYFEMAGHESVEAIDFLGHHVQSSHGIVWKDGKLSQAFRAVSKGASGALLIDEMLRIPQRHLSVLLSALSPDSDGNYRLQTGRMLDVVDGIGVEEELVIPTAKLAVFATTNVGPEFAIDDLDPALAERFIIVRKDTEKKVLIDILAKHADVKNFSGLIAVKLADFFERTQRMVQTGTLNRHATTRTLSRAIEHADNEADVKNILRDQALLWVDRTSAGHPEPSQLGDVYKAIELLFPPPPPASPPPPPPRKPDPATRAATSRKMVDPRDIHELDSDGLFDDLPWSINEAEPARLAKDPISAPSKWSSAPTRIDQRYFSMRHPDLDGDIGEIHVSAMEDHDGFWSIEHIAAESDDPFGSESSIMERLTPAQALAMMKDIRQGYIDSGWVESSPWQVFAQPISDEDELPFDDMPQARRASRSPF